MPIIASASGENFALCPAGSHAAVCVDVEDLGIVDTEFNGEKKKQHKVRIIWQVAEQMDSGKPFSARKRYTLSLHEKSALRKDLESWRGMPFSPAELKGFDLERLIGVGALINVIHEAKNGKTYDNVASIMRMPKGFAPPEPKDYVRACNRKPKDEQESPSFDAETEAPSDDDAPGF